jgi:UDP-N-acetylglucosamine/UDP-N-acetylgalactosamine 4-epimerase
MEKLKGKSILITGGAGFIGSHIADFLTKNNAKFVRVVDNLMTGHEYNIEHLKKYKNFEFMYGDISDFDTCLKVTENIDIVCHQASLGSVPRSIDDPLKSHKNNVDGFVNILYSCIKRNIKHFVYASSSSVYGNIDTLPKVENNIGKHISPYALTKYIGELYADLFNRVYGINCIGLRYFNVFGPRQDPNSMYSAVIPKFITTLINNERPIIYGDGLTSRDFTYVSNVVDANVNALSLYDDETGALNMVYNIAYENQITLLCLFDNIRKICNVNLEPIFKEQRKGDIKHSFANINLAKKHLNYKPSVGLIDGLKLTIDYYKNTKDIMI